MHRILVAAVMFVLVLVTGCASSDKMPKYVTNWESLRTGMSKKQVRELLGRPAYRGEYIGSEMGRPLPKDMPMSDKSGLKSDLEEVFGKPELWQYGRFNLFELPGLFDASDEAFAVYFSRQGRVIRWRRPTRGDFASASQPAEPTIPDGLDTGGKVYGPKSWMDMPE